MTRLAIFLYALIGPTLAGIGIIIALVSGNDTTQPIVIATVIGFVLALPVSWLVARQLA